MAVVSTLFLYAKVMGIVITAKIADFKSSIYVGEQNNFQFL
jgi:hypothetical protein